MIRYLTIDDVIDIHHYALEAFGGTDGILHQGLLESAIANPKAAFGGEEVYPTLFEKAAALAYSLIKNHAFADANKRVAFLSMDTFLRLNGFEIICEQEIGEAVFLAVAAGERSRDQLVEWITIHSHPLEQSTGG